MRHHSMTGVVNVHDEYSARQTWPFECLHCEHVWEEEYVVRHLTDGHGNDVDVWLLGEVPVQPPLSGARCPGCHSTSVTTFPSGYLARHPELITPPPSSAEVAVGLEAAGGGEDEATVRPVSAGGATTRILFLSVIGFTLLLVAGLEIYEKMLAGSRLH